MHERQPNRTRNARNKHNLSFTLSHSDDPFFLLSCCMDVQGRAKLSATSTEAINNLLLLLFPFVYSSIRVNVLVRSVDCDTMFSSRDVLLNVGSNWSVTEVRPLRQSVDEWWCRPRRFNLYLLARHSAGCAIENVINNLIDGFRSFSSSGLTSKQSQDVSLH